LLRRNMIRGVVFRDSPQGLGACRPKYVRRSMSRILSGQKAQKEPPWNALSDGCPTVA
jgi:hypothetical protein